MYKRQPLPEATLAACRRADAVLLGAVGGPKWDHLRGALRCEAGLLGLRRGMGVFANLRPVRVHPRLIDHTTIRPEVVRGTDMVIVRELTGGAYFGEPRERSGTGPEETARDSTVYTAAEIERVARIAFALAAGRRHHLTSVDKANVLITSQLWRDTVIRLAGEYPEVTLEHALVDSFAMRLVQRPAGVDVVVTENLFGLSLIHIWCPSATDPSTPPTGPSTHWSRWRVSWMSSRCRPSRRGWTRSGRSPSGSGTTAR